MSGMRDTAITHPVGFAFLTLVILYVLYIAAGVVAAVALHLLLNAYVGARAVGVAGFEETVAAWGIIILLGLPLPVLGLCLLRGVDGPTSGTGPAPIPDGHAGG